MRKEEKERRGEKKKKEKKEKFRYGKYGTCMEIMCMDASLELVGNHIGLELFGDFI